jgi:hypothetical protein
MVRKQNKHNSRTFFILLPKSGHRRGKKTLPLSSFLPRSTGGGRARGGRDMPTRRRRHGEERVQPRVHKGGGARSLLGGPLADVLTSTNLRWGLVWGTRTHAHARSCVSFVVPRSYRILRRVVPLHLLSLLYRFGRGVGGALPTLSTLYSFSSAQQKNI